MIQMKLWTAGKTRFGCNWQTCSCMRASSQESQATGLVLWWYERGHTHERQIYHYKWHFKLEILIKWSQHTNQKRKELITEANMKDSKMLWNIVKDLAPKAKSALPVSLRDGDTVLSDTQDICDSFNNLFANIATEYTNNLPTHSFTRFYIFQIGSK